MFFVCRGVPLSKEKQVFYNFEVLGKVNIENFHFPLFNFY